MIANVALVGAGPGAPDLITVRGLHRIQSAQVLMHDRLVARELIAQAPAGCLCVNVGKSADRARFPQSAIDRILVEQAALGLRVVRLKGGDPFVFGLGGQEAQALARAGLDYEVVPGLSSATALPSLAGAQLTQKGASAGFVVLSGHRGPGEPGAADFARLPAHTTLVLLMAQATLSSIARCLTESGWESTTPALLIHSGSTPRERSVWTTLKSLGQQPPSAPLLVVLGAHLRPPTEHLQRTIPPASWGLSRRAP